MLIRWITEKDKQAWMRLAESVVVLFGSPEMATDPSFLAYIDSKITNYEALIAVGRMSGDCLGIIGFSRRNNRISWLAVIDCQRCKGIGSRLLKTALRQLDDSKAIEVVTFAKDDPGGLPAYRLYQKAGFIGEESDFIDHLGNRRCKMALAPRNEKRSGSFHYRYLDYVKMSIKEFCPACLSLPMPDGQLDIGELDYSFTTAERVAQGKLFGKCYVIAKLHVVDFEEMPKVDMMSSGIPHQHTVNRVLARKIQVAMHTSLLRRH